MIDTASSTPSLPNQRISPRRSTSNYSLPVYSLKLIRERTVRYRSTIDSPEAAAAAVLRVMAADADREHFIVLFLNTAKELIGAHVAFIGSLNAVGTVTAREVFKAAIVANASAIILGHNHPSGDVQPSPQDQTTTDHLVEASKVVGIPILDHVIVGGDSEPYSFYVNGRLP